MLVQTLQWMVSVRFSYQPIARHPCIHSPILLSRALHFFSSFKHTLDFPAFLCLLTALSAPWLSTSHPGAQGSAQILSSPRSIPSFGEVCPCSVFIHFICTSLTVLFTLYLESIICILRYLLHCQLLDSRDHFYGLTCRHAALAGLLI